MRINYVQTTLYTPSCFRVTSLSGSLQKKAVIFRVICFGKYFIGNLSIFIL